MVYIPPNRRGIMLQTGFWTQKSKFQQDQLVTWTTEACDPTVFFTEANVYTNLCRVGVRPSWRDPANEGGYMLRCKAGYTDPNLKYLLEIFMSNKLPHGQHVTCITRSPRRCGMIWLSSAISSDALAELLSFLAATTGMHFEKCTNNDLRLEKIVGQQPGVVHELDSQYIETYQPAVK